MTTNLKIIYFEIGIEIIIRCQNHCYCYIYIANGGLPGFWEKKNGTHLGKLFATNVQVCIHTHLLHVFVEVDVHR